MNQVVSCFVNEFSKSDGYREQLRRTFHVDALNGHHVSIGLTCTLRIENFFFTNYATSVQSESTPGSNYIGCDDGKIRYVVDMCIGKVLHRDTNYVCRNIYKYDDNVHMKKNIATTLRKHTLNSLTIAKSESMYPDSSKEIEPRQTKYGYLTIVDDVLFKLFQQFDVLLQPQLTLKNLEEKKDSLFSDIIHNTIYSLLETPHLDIPNDLYTSVLYPVFRIYVRTILNEMRIKVCDAFNVKKKMAHRKQVLLEEIHRSPAKRTKLSPCNDNSVCATAEPSCTTVSSVNPPSTDDDNTCAT